MQPPSAVDENDARGYNAINIVVGAANKRVYFYNSAGVIAQMRLKDFMK